MYACEESVGRQPAKFADGHGVDAIEVYGHCSSCSEGVAGDHFWFEALFCQARVYYCLLNSCRYVSLSHILYLTLFCDIEADWCGGIRCV